MGDYDTMTKYCPNSGFGYNGFTDDKTVLDSEDDAAHEKLGGNWRMPIDAEWAELVDKCTWTWTTQNGVSGMLVTANNGKSIFIPIAGYRLRTSLSDVDSYGIYWSSSLDTDNPIYALGAIIGSGGVDRDCYDRCVGISVRPVYAE